MEDMPTKQMRYIIYCETYFGSMSISSITGVKNRDNDGLQHKQEKEPEQNRKEAGGENIAFLDASVKAKADDGIYNTECDNRQKQIAHIHYHICDTEFRRDKACESRGVSRKLSTLELNVPIAKISVFERSRLYLFKAIPQFITYFLAGKAAAFSLPFRRKRLYYSLFFDGNAMRVRQRHSIIRQTDLFYRFLISFLSRKNDENIKFFHVLQHIFARPAKKSKP